MTVFFFYASFFANSLQALDFMHVVLYCQDFLCQVTIVVSPEVYPMIAPICATFGPLHRVQLGGGTTRFRPIHD